MHRPRLQLWLLLLFAVVALSAQSVFAGKKQLYELINTSIVNLSQKTGEMKACPPRVLNKVDAITGRLKNYLSGDVGKELILIDDGETAHGKDVAHGGDISVSTANTPFNTSLDLDTRPRKYSVAAQNPPQYPLTISAKEVQHTGTDRLEKIIERISWSEHKGFELENTITKPLAATSVASDNTSDSGWTRFAKGTSLEAIIDAVCEFCKHEIPDAHRIEDVLSKLSLITQIDGIKWSKIKDHPLEPGNLTLATDLHGYEAYAHFNWDQSLDRLLLLSQPRARNPFPTLFRILFPGGPYGLMGFQMKTAFDDKVQSFLYSISYPYENQRRYVTVESIQQEEAIPRHLRGQKFNFIAFERR